MILNDDTSPGDPLCFPKQEQGLIGVVQYIYKECEVKALVLAGNADAVERLDWNAGRSPWQNINAVNLQTGSPFLKQVTQETVPATDVQNRAIRRKKPQQVVAENIYPPLKHV
jgi:hypothetical protein